MNFSLKAFKLCCFVFKFRFTTLVTFFTKTANSCRPRGRCDFFSLSLQAITKIMQTKEKNKACIFKGQMQRNLHNYSLVEKPLQNVICTNIKKNQLFEISFVWTVAPNTWKSNDFRELHENEPEMAVLGVRTTTLAIYKITSNLDM